MSKHPVPFIPFGGEGTRTTRLVAAGFGELDYSFALVRKNLMDLDGAHGMLSMLLHHLQNNGVHAAANLVVTRATGGNPESEVARQIDDVTQYAVAVINLRLLLAPMQLSMERLQTALARAERAVNERELTDKIDLAFAQANCVAARQLLSLSNHFLNTCQQLVGEAALNEAQAVIASLYADPRSADFGGQFHRPIQGYARRA